MVLRNFGKILKTQTLEKFYINYKKFFFAFVNSKKLKVENCYKHLRRFYEIFWIDYLR